MAATSCGLKTTPQRLERVQYGAGLFPAVCFHEDLSREPVPWHWHPDLEVGVVLQGTAVVSAGPDRLTVRPGEGFLINAEVLHALRSADASECLLHSVVFHPRLVGGGADSIFWQNYIQPLISDSSRQSVCFDRSEPWHGEAVKAIEAAWDNCAKEPPGYDLQVRNALSHLAFLLSCNRPAGGAAPSEKALRDEARMKRMLQFIQDHYAGEVNTAAIAGSAAISQSECLRCFRSAIGAAPSQYLKQFRIQQAAGLLRTTRLSVAEVGARCGFQDASYFTKAFREAKGCTPSAYREQGQNGFSRPENGCQLEIP